MCPRHHRIQAVSIRNACNRPRLNRRIRCRNNDPRILCRKLQWKPGAQFWLGCRALRRNSLSGLRSGRNWQQKNQYRHQQTQQQSTTQPQGNSPSESSRNLCGLALQSTRCRRPNHAKTSRPNPSCHYTIPETTYPEADALKSTRPSGSGDPARGLQGHRSSGIDLVSASRSR